MALDPNIEYCGCQILELDGQVIAIDSVDATVKTGATPVPTMNPTMEALGSSCGVKSYELKIEVPILVDQSAEPDWETLTNGTITLYPQCGTNGTRTIYTGCRLTEMGEKYKINTTAMRSLSLFALSREVV